MAMDIVKRIDFARGRTQLPLTRLCRDLGVSIRTLRRWNSRRGANEPLLRAPGPAKTGAFDPAVLAGELASLPHGGHRTAGMGLLYSKYGEAISRRELASLAEDVRQEQNDAEHRNQRRIEWLVPGICWATDGTTFTSASTGKQEILTVRDSVPGICLSPWSPSGRHAVAR